MALGEAHRLKLNVAGEDAVEIKAHGRAQLSAAGAHQLVGVNPLADAATDLNGLCQGSGQHETSSQQKQGCQCLIMKGHLCWSTVGCTALCSRNSELPSATCCTDERANAASQCAGTAVSAGDQARKRSVACLLLLTRPLLACPVANGCRLRSRLLPVNKDGHWCCDSPSALHIYFRYSIYCFRSIRVGRSLRFRKQSEVRSNELRTNDLHWISAAAPAWRTVSKV